MSEYTPTLVNEDFGCFCADGGSGCDEEAEGCVPPVRLCRNSDKRPAKVDDSIFDILTGGAASDGVRAPRG